MRGLSILALFGWVVADATRLLGRHPSPPPLHLDEDELEPGGAAMMLKNRDCRNCGSAVRMVYTEIQTGFPSRPPADQWASRLKALGDAARADPCNADKVAVSFERSFGFGSRMNAFIDELLYAMYGNYTIAVCGSNPDGFYKRVWSRLFENQLDLPVCTNAPPFCGDETPEAFWPGMLLSERLWTDGFSEYLVGVKGYLARLALAPTPALNKSVNERLAEAGLDSEAGKAYLGMHIRRGDKIIWETHAVPATVFADEAQRYLRNTSSPARKKARTPIYLASDDASAPEELSEALGQRFKVLRQSWTSKMADREYDEDQVVQIVADIKALVSAELFIGSSSSNIGRLVYVQRGWKSPSVTVDDDGQWLKRG